MATILVVDDSLDVRSFVVDVLSGHNGKHHIIEAENGKEAQEKIIKANFLIGLIITDFSMPLMNGIELTLWIKEKHPEIPVILMSSDDHSRSIVVDAFIRKPDGFGNFLSIVEKLLQKRSPRRKTR